MEEAFVVDFVGFAVIVAVVETFVELMKRMMVVLVVKHIQLVQLQVLEELWLFEEPVFELV